MGTAHLPPAHVSVSGDTALCSYGGTREDISNYVLHNRKNIELSVIKRQIYNLYSEEMLRNFFASAPNSLVIGRKMFFSDSTCEYSFDV